MDCFSEVAREIARFFTSVTGTPAPAARVLVQPDTQRASQAGRRAIREGSILRGRDVGAPFSGNGAGCGAGGSSEEFASASGVASLGARDVRAHRGESDGLRDFEESQARQGGDLFRRSIQGDSRFSATHGAGSGVVGFTSFSSGSLDPTDISPFVPRLRPFLPSAIAEHRSDCRMQSFVKTLDGASYTIEANPDAQVAEYIQTIIQTLVRIKGEGVLSEYKKFKLISCGRLIAIADNKGQVFHLPTEFQSLRVRDFAPHGTLMQLVLSHVTPINCENLLRLRDFLARGHMQADFAIVLSSSENTLFRLYTRYISGGKAIGIEIENYEHSTDRLAIRFTPANELEMTDQLRAILSDPENIWSKRLETFIESIQSCDHRVENPPISQDQFSAFVAYLQTLSHGDPLPLTDHLGVEYYAILENESASGSYKINIQQYAPEDPTNNLEFRFYRDGNLQSITINGVLCSMEELIDPSNPRSLSLYACFHRLQIQGRIPKEVDSSFSDWSVFLPRLLLKGNYVQDRPFLTYNTNNKLFIATDVLNGFRIYLDTQEARLAMIFSATGALVGVEINGVAYLDQFNDRNDMWKNLVFSAFKELFVKEGIYHQPHSNTLWVHPNSLAIAPIEFARRFNLLSFDPRVTHIGFLNDLFQEGPALDVGGLSREFFSSLSGRLFTRSSGLLKRREDSPYRPYAIQGDRAYMLTSTLARSISSALLSPHGVRLGYLFDKNFYAVLKAACDIPSYHIFALSQVLQMILPESPYRSSIARWYGQHISREAPINIAEQADLRRDLLEMCTDVFCLDPPSDESEATIDSYLNENLKELFQKQVEEAQFIKAVRENLRSDVVVLIQTIPTAEAFQIAVEGVAFTADDILERMRVDEAMMVNYSASPPERDVFYRYYQWMREIINEQRENPEWLALFVQFMTGQNNAPRDTLFKFSITRLYEDRTTRSSHRGDQFHIHTCSARLDMPPLAAMTKEDLLMSIEALMAARGYNAD
jgi:hypothetical protein